MTYASAEFQPVKWGPYSQLNQTNFTSMIENDEAIYRLQNYYGYGFQIWRDAEHGIDTEDELSFEDIYTSSNADSTRIHAITDFQIMVHEPNELWVVGAVIPWVKLHQAGSVSASFAHRCWLGIWDITTEDEEVRKNIITGQTGNVNTDSDYWSDKSFSISGRAPIEFDTAGVKNIQITFESYSQSDNVGASGMVYRGTVTGINQIWIMCLGTAHDNIAVDLGSIRQFGW